MNTLLSLWKSSAARWAGLLVCVVAGVASRDRWWPRVDSLVDQWVARPAAKSGHEAHGPPVEHGAAAPAVNSSLDLSKQAMLNLGLTQEFLRPVELSTYRKTISIPGSIVERPGQSLIQVSTPMTGVITEVAAFRGAAVEPGQLLFRIRLTHEDLVQSQTDLVKALGELDVENREIARLQVVTDSGAIAGKSLLERKYAKEKLEALLQAQRETLRLHGLSPRQVEQISRDRRLLSELSVTVPAADQKPGELQLTDRSGRQPVAFIAEEPATQAGPSMLIIESLDVQRGQSVEQGGKLCVLADYSRLYIEGRAFEQDIEAVNSVLSKGWNVSAVLTGGTTIGELPLSFVSSEIDPESHTLRFYVDLPNAVLRDSVNADKQRFVTWKYKPGQRLQLRIPVEEWPNQIVLPVDAVAAEGAESFVFRRNGRTFQRVSVQVLHTDQTSVVIANDGSVSPGEVVALRSSHQMQMAIKNKSGGAIDPHAGHNHAH